jgi:hypothetical protein
MIGLLNRFHATASLAIQNSGGAVDKYVGDGLTATFGLPQPLAAPQRNALEAAQDLLLRVERLNRELAAEGIEPLQIGIGIHSGEVLAGYVGSRQRREFSVIGDVRRHRQPPRSHDQGVQPSGALLGAGGGRSRIWRRPGRAGAAGRHRAACLGLDAAGANPGGSGRMNLAPPRSAIPTWQLLWFATSRHRELRRPLLRAQLAAPDPVAGVAALPIIMVLAVLTGAAVSTQLAALIGADAI